MLQVARYIENIAFFTTLSFFNSVMSRCNSSPDLPYFLVLGLKPKRPSDSREFKSTAL